MGWSGPVAVASGPSTPPTCPNDYPTQATAGLLHSGLAASPTKCPCICTTPLAPKCSSATLTKYNQLGNFCTEKPKSLGTLPSGSCVGAVITATLLDSVRAVGVFSAGPCASNANPQPPLPSWATDARACEGTAVAGQCAGGEVCVPAVPAAWESCIYRAGDVSCPSGYSVKQVLFDGVDDTRSCSPCGCGTPTGTCTGMVNLYNSASCSAPIGTLSLKQCTSAISMTHAKYVAGTPTGSSCPETGGDLSGTLTPKNPTTFCCTN